MNQSIKVSIICAAYNQENYIGQALDGFVMQKCGFPFEALVHDDLSTDSTASIIREYEAKHPDIIRGIYEKENLYSRGKHMIREILKYAKGEYIAICEGDDYWTDENKLRLQVEYLDSHPDCSICCHAFAQLDSHTGKVTHARILDGDGDISFERILSNKNTPHTATLLVRRKLMEQQPDFFDIDVTGDYPLKLWMTLNGKFHYIDREMSCYRVMSVGSWSSKLEKDRQRRASRLERRIRFLTELDSFTNGRYSDEINNQLDSFCFKENYLLGRYKEARKSPLFKQQSAAKKAFILFGSVFPGLALKLHDKR